MRPCWRGEPALGPGQQRPDHGLGDAGKDRCRGVAVDQAEQHVQADLELAVVRKAAHRVQDVLDVVAARQGAIELAGKGLRARDRLEEVGRQHGVEQAHVAAEMAGEPRCCPHQVGDQGQQARIGAEQREQLHAGRQAADELVEAGERCVRLGLGRERVQQLRHQVGQQLARAGIAGRPDMAVVPGADPRRDRLRPREPHLRQGGDRRRVVLGAGEHQSAAGAEIDAALEQRGIVPLDGLEAGAHGVVQRSRRRHSP